MIADAPSPLVLPVYDAGNPDHISHVYEDFSAYSGTPPNIATTNRGDGGASWANSGASFKSLSATDLPPSMTVQRCIINLEDAPSAGPPPQSLSRGLSLDHDDATKVQFLNRTSVKAAIVFEWWWRFTSTMAYEGKIADFQPVPGTDRFNYQAPANDRLGDQLAADCDSDTLCNLYYNSNGSVPEPALAAKKLLPTATTFCAHFARSINLDTVFFVQNRNFGTGADEVSWGGSNGANMVNSTWKRTILRLTNNQPGQAVGHGRLEEWLEYAGGNIVKVMEYVGDVGQFDQGLVRTRSSTWIANGCHFSWYDLTSVFDIFAGGCTLELGGLRIWSHPREEF